jgi:hypothetical protein
MKLTDGITFNGKPIDEPFLTAHETNEIQELRRQEMAVPRLKGKPKNKAFAKERMPGKIQRVSETIIYDKEGVRELKNKQYHAEFKTFIVENMGILPLASLGVANFGARPGKQDVNQLMESLALLMDSGKKPKQKIRVSTLSHHLSAYWKNNKIVRLFVVRSVEKTFRYEMTEIGLQIGPEILTRYRNLTVPESYEKLRLQLSEMRIAAKTRGISEDEFNDFLKMRFEQIKQELIPNRKPQKPSARTLKKPKPEKVKEAIETGALKARIEDMPLTPEPSEQWSKPGPSIDTGTLRAMEQDEILKRNKELEQEISQLKAQEYWHDPDKQQIERTPASIAGIVGKDEPQEPKQQTIEFDIKIWFVPVTGRITIK